MNFLKYVISMMAIYVENLKNYIKGEFVKIREFTQVIIFVISHQKWQAYIESEKKVFFKFLEIQPSYYTLAWSLQFDHNFQLN